MIKRYRITRAFRKLFFQDGKLKPEAKIVIAFLRDECGGRGELCSPFGSPYLYDKNGRFDSGSAAYLLGRRRVFDLIIRYLSLDERLVFNLLSEDEKEIDTDTRIENIFKG